MATHSFTVKRKAVPQLLPQDYLQQPPSLKYIPIPPAINHAISLPNFHPSRPLTTPSPKKRKPFASLKKMLSFSRLHATITQEPLIPVLPPLRHSNISASASASWRSETPDLSPPSRPASSPVAHSALSSIPTALSTIRISTDSSSSLPSSSRRAPTDPGARPGDSPRVDSAANLASPASQRSCLTSWYDAWFETQSLLEHQRQQDALREQPQPASFFEDDSDEGEDLEADDEFTSDTESDFASILPDCSPSQSDSDEDTDIDDIDEGDVTLTIGQRVICRRASCRLFSSAEDSHSDSSLRNRNRPAFDLERERVSGDY